MTPTKKNAPGGLHPAEGRDQNTYQEEPIVMKTTSPILAPAPDNEELATSGDSILVACDDESCAYINHGHWADRQDPLFVHHYVGVDDDDFHLVIQRLSVSPRYELSVEIRTEDMTPDQAKRFARVLTRCSEIADNLNAERA